jgi:hypothetical protein
MERLQRAVLVCLTVVTVTAIVGCVVLCTVAAPHPEGLCATAAAGVGALAALASGRGPGPSGPAPS